ncbi:MAG: hypothetical protein SFY80_10195 [Verrucomicrobiota bacterium]|nr:hypothetical protein [Verrucomicrobiota bacterium]
MNKLTWKWEGHRGGYRGCDAFDPSTTLFFVEYNDSKFELYGAFIKDENEPIPHTTLTAAKSSAEECYGKWLVQVGVEQCRRALESIYPGVKAISDERVRQVSHEGWTSEDDDRRTYGQLASAAITYIQAHLVVLHYKPEAQPQELIEQMATFWPFDEEWFKPTSPIRNLEKAGALIAAEIDRLKRLNAKEVA